MAKFPSTSWSMVLAAGADASVEAQAALSELCQAYWRPLHGYILSRGYAADDALDLTQEFFARLIEKNYSAHADRERGRFRTFLLASVRHFLAAQARRTRAQKRGGGAEGPLPLDFEPASAASATPAQVFERHWALNVIDRAMAGLRNSAHFESLKTYLIADDANPAYRQLAAQLGITESALKTKIHRMRRRFGELLRWEIAQTVESEEQIDEELRYLFDVLSR
jgi:RNA polymerase sigma-70 factor (ECF subfamily)